MRAVLAPTGNPAARDHTQASAIVAGVRDEGGSEMVLTPEQIEAFKAAAQPLMSWLDANCHPHCTVIVDSTRAEVVEGVACIHNPEPPRD